MKFARRLAIVSWVSVLGPFAIACGSAGSSSLFSSSGGSGDLGKAGADGVAAGASSAGADTAGASAAGASSGGAPGTAGKGSAGESGHTSGGSSGAGSSGSAGKGQGGGSSGGSAGAAAGAGGNSAGSGGALAGAGGMGGTAAGSGGVAGDNAGGSGGSAGAVGTGCPVLAPTPTGVCQTMTPNSCFYPGLACTCLPIAANEFTRRWACYGTPDKCPDNEPAPGSGPCKNGAQCPYPGGDFCACDSNNFGSNRFACQPDAPVCPVFKPGKGMPCSLPVRTCAYADNQCFCDGSNWDCEG